MAALIGPDGKYLIESYAMSISPGLQLMPPRPIPRGEVAVLANGLSEAKTNFSPLANVPGELKSIQDVYHMKGSDKLISETDISSQ